MKKRRRHYLKSILIVLLLVILSCTFIACSEQEENPNPYNFGVQEATSDFYVNDFANIFDSGQKEKMMKNAVNLAEEYSGIQVVVTTVESFDKTIVEWQGTKPKTFEIEQVAYAMFNQYEIGKDDMGLLILFSVEDREVRIETGRNMQAYITDAMSGQLLDDYGMDYFREDNFAEGLLSVQTATIEEVKKRVPANWNAGIIEETEDKKLNEESVIVEDTNIPTGSDNSSQIQDDNRNGLITGLFMAIGAFVAAIIALILKLFKNKNKLEEKEKKRLNDLQELKASCNNRISEIRFENEEKLADLERKKDLEIASLRRELEEKGRKLDHTNSELELLKEKYARIQTLHPEMDFEAEIQEMIESEYKEEAAAIDEKLENALNTKADKDNIVIFEDAIKLYNDADLEVEKYITSDIAKIKLLLSESFRLKEEYERIEQEKKDKAYASQVESEITNIMAQNQLANHQTYQALNDGYQKYKNLTGAQKAFFVNASLITNLKKQVGIAKEDYDNYQKAQEVEEGIRSVIGYKSSADEDDLDKLRRLKRSYNNLTTEQKKYFPSDLASKLNRLISEAEDDERRQEEARRRRRMQASSSSYHGGFSGSRPGGYSGFGGRSGGGGASRKF